MTGLAGPLRVFVEADGCRACLDAGLLAAGDGNERAFGQVRPGPVYDRWPSPPVAAERIAPPFASSVSTGTAMPRVDSFGSTTS
ncbi:MAG: hypothetical protein OXC11_13310 [Rhodospirillales bacterium]|nr:hypothetical protein [Rhodospirillales bacterium]